MNFNLLARAHLADVNLNCTCLRNRAHAQSLDFSATVQYAVDKYRYCLKSIYRIYSTGTGRTMDMDQATTKLGPVPVVDLFLENKLTADRQKQNGHSCHLTNRTVKVISYVSQDVEIEIRRWCLPKTDQTLIITQQR